MTENVIVTPYTQWPRRCTRCGSRVLTPTKQAMQECDRCHRWWVDPEAVEAIDVGMWPKGQALVS